MAQNHCPQAPSLVLLYPCCNWRFQEWGVKPSFVEVTSREDASTALPGQIAIATAQIWDLPINGGRGAWISLSCSGGHCMGDFPQTPVGRQPLLCAATDASSVAWIFSVLHTHRSPVRGHCGDPNAGCSWSKWVRSWPGDLAESTSCKTPHTRL